MNNNWWKKYFESKQTSSKISEKTKEVNNKKECSLEDIKQEISTATPNDMQRQLYKINNLTEEGGAYTPETAEFIVNRYNGLYGSQANYNRSNIFRKIANSSSFDKLSFETQKKCILVQVPLIYLIAI